MSLHTFQPLSEFQLFVKVIWSVWTNDLEMMSMKVLESLGLFSARMDVSIKVWHIVQTMRSASRSKCPSQRDNLERWKLQNKIEQVGVVYSQLPDSAQTLIDLLFPWRNEESATNPTHLHRQRKWAIKTINSTGRMS